MLVNSSLCLSLLLSGGPRLSPPTPLQESAALEWLENQKVHSPDQALVRRTLENWELWKNVTPSARTANLNLELSRLRPAEKGALIDLHGQSAAEALSKANLVRMKEQIRSRLPLDPQTSSEVTAQAKEIRDNISFHYLRQNHARLPSGVNPPLVSSRELAKHGLDFSPSFYSQLVGGSPSVDFLIVASKAKPGSHSIEAQLPFNAVSLERRLAAEAGFALPHFADAKDLIKFFSMWEPERVEALLRENRMSLPREVDTLHKFISYVDSSRIEILRLAVLREALANYFFTEADAKELLLWAFERWLTSVAVNDPEQFARHQRTFTLAPGAHRLFSKEFLPQLHLPLFNLRVPVAVGPASYFILMGDNQARSRPYPADVSRLDHNSKP